MFCSEERKGLFAYNALNESSKQHMFPLSLQTLVIVFRGQTFIYRHLVEVENSMVEVIFLFVQLSVHKGFICIQSQDSVVHFLFFCFFHSYMHFLLFLLLIQSLLLTVFLLVLLFCIFYLIFAFRLIFLKLFFFFNIFI